MEKTEIPTFKKSIFNRRELKDLILKRIEALRPGWKCTGVSKESMDEIEGFIRYRIDQGIRKHPSGGKRFRWPQLW